jgi:hypothetical protein
VATSQPWFSGAGVIPSVAQALSDQLPGEQPLAVAQDELAQVDRSAAQPGAVIADLTDPVDADEHPAPLHGDDKSVDARGLGAEVDDRIHDAADVGAVGAQQRQAGEPLQIDDPPFHDINRTIRGCPNPLSFSEPATWAARSSTISSP